MRLADKVAIITGASGGVGLGRALPTAFASEGARLSLNYYKQDSSEFEGFMHALSSKGVQLNVMEGDISQEDTVRLLVESTMDKFGRIDILINNAGISTQSPIRNMSTAMWDRMLEVNLRSVFLTTRYVVPIMIAQQRGRIINIASQLGQKGGVDNSHYAAAKAGVIGFTKSIALELGQHGITANCIAPGLLDTQLSTGLDEEWKKRKLSELAISRMGKVEEVVPTALLLASEPDGNIYTGQTLGPNCGDVML